MYFKRAEPRAALSQLIDCYWLAENDAPDAGPEKIIPDGFTEIIFHYGDPYQVNMTGEWQDQGKAVIAGQIDKHLYLRPTGKVGMVAIKFKPTGVHALFGVDMGPLTNQVPDLYQFCPGLSVLEKPIHALKRDHEQLFKLLDDHFAALASTLNYQETHSDKAVQLIAARNGAVTVDELAEACGISSRQLERQFKRAVGVSPKRYARIIRFNHIFQLIRGENPQWTEVAYLAGFYDQAHFIRNFQAFTGEDPSTYAFDEKSFANFFLRRM